jgi:hypothetical protein
LTPSLAQESAATNAPAGRAALTSAVDTSQTAAERWRRLKSSAAIGAPFRAPASATAPAPAVQPAAPPLPEVETESPAPPIEHFAPALPDAAIEPAWLVPLRELTDEEADLTSEPPASPEIGEWRPAARPESREWRPTAPHVDAADFNEVDAAEEPWTDIATVAQVSPAVIWPLLPASDPRRELRGIREISPYYDLTVDKDIRDYADKQAANYGVKFGDEVYRPRAFPDAVFPWEAPNLWHYPLYFEDPALERYGHSHGYIAQPFWSVARFSGQLLALPYQMTIDPPCCPVYALGWYRPGDCAPKLKYKIPWNTHAAAVEAGVVTGLFFLIP